MHTAAMDRIWVLETVASTSLSPTGSDQSFYNQH